MHDFYRLAVCLQKSYIAISVGRPWSEGCEWGGFITFSLYHIVVLHR